MKKTNYIQKISSSVMGVKRKNKFQKGEFIIAFLVNSVFVLNASIEMIGYGRTSKMWLQNKKNK